MSSAPFVLGLGKLRELLSVYSNTIMLLHSVGAFVKSCQGLEAPSGPAFFTPARVTLECWFSWEDGAFLGKHSEGNTAPPFEAFQGLQMVHYLT